MTCQEDTELIEELRDEVADLKIDLQEADDALESIAKIFPLLGILWRAAASFDRGDEAIRLGFGERLDLRDGLDMIKSGALGCLLEKSE